MTDYVAKTGEFDVALLRADLELTQPELARIIGVSTTTVSRWERSCCSPDDAKAVGLMLLVRALTRHKTPRKVRALLLETETLESSRNQAARILWLTRLGDR